LRSRVARFHPALSTSLASFPTGRSNPPLPPTALTQFQIRVVEILPHLDAGATSGQRARRARRHFLAGCNRPVGLRLLSLNVHDRPETRAPSCPAGVALGNRFQPARERAVGRCQARLENIRASRTDHHRPVQAPAESHPAGSSVVGFRAAFVERSRFAKAAAPASTG
jgi:hypothetical protein